MTKTIAIDPGHDITTPGKETPTMTDGKKIKENQFNEPTANFLRKELVRCGFKVVMVAPEVGYDTPLAIRVQRALAAGADAFISIHYDAFRGNWDETKGGITSLYQPGNYEGKQLASCIHEFVTQGTSQVDRGVKAQDLYVLRNFKGRPGALIENGFMDVSKEAELMLNVEYQKEQAKQIAQGICKYFKVRYVPEGVEEVAEQIKIKVDGKIIANQKMSPMDALKIAIDNIPELTYDIATGVINIIHKKNKP